MTQPLCPSRAELADYLVGLLSGERHEALSRHLDECADCQASLPLVEGAASPLQLRPAEASHAGSFEEEPELQQALLRVSAASLSRSEPELLHAATPEAYAYTLPSRIGDYELLEEIARGGMGVVFKARQISLNRIVAVKMTRAGQLASAEETQRFRMEAEAAAKLDHPAIVPIYEVGEEDGRHYFSMALVEGASLAQTIAERPLPPREAATLVRQVAEAVAYAHSQGVIHRDLKPGNILLAAGQPRVTDFGLAKRADSDSDLTRTGQVLGTPSYMAPEQAEGKVELIGPRSDVYALGATLYCLLTGRPPFHAATTLETLRQVAYRDPVPPRQLNAAIAPDLETICLKCLEKRPEGRYQSARDLAEELSRFLEGLPIRARPVGAIGRAVRWWRRRPAVAGLSAAIVLVALAGVGAVVWQWRKAVTLAEAADRSAEEARQHTRAERWQRYRSNIAAALSALRLHNDSAVRRALQAAPEEYRNWEWHYLSSQLEDARTVLPGLSFAVLSPDSTQVAAYGRQDPVIHLWDLATSKRISLRGHKAPVSPKALNYSPDGTRIASGSADGTARLWDARTGRALAVLRGHTGPVSWVGFSPDGKRLASGGAADSALRLWDGVAGQQVAVLRGHTGPVTKLIRGAAARSWVSSSADGTVRTWGENGEPLAVLRGHRHPVVTLAVSPDGKRIASADAVDPVIRLWDGETGKEVARLSGHALHVRLMVFSPDGSRLASSSEYKDTPGRLWDGVTGKPIAVLAEHRNTIERLSFSPDGKRLLTTGLDSRGLVWDARTGRLLATLRGHTRTVADGSFSPDGKRIVTASLDETVRLWQSESGEPISVLHGHTGDVLTARFSGDGAWIVSAGDEVCVWQTDLATRGAVLRGHTSYVYDVTFSPDGKTLASAAWDGTVRLWDTRTHRQLHRLQHDDDIVSSVSFSPDGKTLASGEHTGRVFLWDVTTGRKKQVLPGGGGDHRDTRIAFSPKGPELAATGLDGRVRLWTRAALGIGHWALVGLSSTEAQCLMPNAEFLPGHQGYGLEVAFRPDGRQLISTATDRTVRVWDVATRKPVTMLRGHKDDVQRVAFSKDGRLLATAALDKTVRLWEVGSYREVAVLEQGSLVYGVAFSPDGTRLAAGCANGTIRLWDVASLSEVADLHGHEDYVHAVAFSPDGTQLASASGDFTVRLWDILPARVRARR